MSDWNTLKAPDEAGIEAMAQAALQALPAEFRTLAQEVAIRVADFAPDDLLDEMQIDDPFDLTGLYEGIPVTENRCPISPLARISSGCSAGPCWMNGRRAAMSALANW